MKKLQCSPYHLVEFCYIPHYVTEGYYEFHGVMSATMDLVLIPLLWNLLQLHKMFVNILQVTIFIDLF